MAIPSPLTHYPSPVTRHMSQNIYIFSGLGADERVFQKLDFSGFVPVFIKWIKPNKDESIENYAERLLGQIDENRPILIGLSFGGMMAMEVAKHIETKRVILIASAKTMIEIPFYFRWAGKLRLHRFLPTVLLKNSNFLTNWAFGVNSESDKLLLKQILHDTDPMFLHWAIDKIVCWKNKIYPPNTLHIHGTSDQILPVRFVKCDAMVTGGGHLMTMNMAEEVMESIRKGIGDVHS